MKKRLLIPALALTALIIPAGVRDASATLTIYKVKGNVTVKTKADKAVKAERRAVVAPADLLTVPEGGNIEILDSDTRRIYSSVNSGKMTVKKLMEKAEDHAASITRNINRKVAAAVAENGRQNRTGYDALGMAIHETDAIAYPDVAIPDGMSYLAYLIGNASGPDADHQNYIRLATTTSAANDSTFNFVVLSSVHEPLFFNIIDRKNKDDIQLLLPQNPIAAPKTVTVASEYRFMKDENGIGNDGYIVIASDKDFTAAEIKKLLEPGYEPENDYYLSILTP
ncbi:MAG: hypothetical protein K2G85_03660 [Muribaculaceae bacterium]|nr:hypothetical protein [Muribaculaceae bacterium]